MGNERLSFKNITYILYNGALLPDVAPHEEVKLSENEAKELIKKTGAYFVRWTEDFDSKINYPFWYVIKDEKEDVSLKEYPSKIRSEIRRGIRNNKVFILEGKDRNRYITDLYEIYVEAFRRYKNIYIQPTNFENFKKSILSSQDCDVWGVMNTKFNKLVAFSIVKVQGKERNVASYSVIKLHPDFLKFYPSYALIFEMNRFYLNEKKFFVCS